MMKKKKESNDYEGKPLIHARSSHHMDLTSE